MFGRKKQAGLFAIEGFGLIWRPPTFHEIRWDEDRTDHLLCSLSESSEVYVVLAPGNGISTDDIHPFEWGSKEVGIGVGYRRGETGAFVGWPIEGGKNLVSRSEIALGGAEANWQIVTRTARVPMLQGFVAHPSSADDSATLCFNDAAGQGILVNVLEARPMPPPDPRILAGGREIINQTANSLEAFEEDDQENPARIIWRRFEREGRWYAVMAGCVLDDRNAMIRAQERVIELLHPSAGLIQ